MKTAMQELIDELERVRLMTNMNFVIRIATDLIEKEREQIIDAHIEGQRVFDNYKHTQWTNDQAEQYYNQTYNQNK